ncbi:hypothetical protein OXPF_07310 [Oxobacter pfennigii]|uniref:Uncharacterized protein n=1 Tax=Oxobacter pfennigii TaxID=36849 RepID=A0A0P8WC76_9CLOT|nr:hypothetical protein [Oxobacter pfennigii]KPU45498.1 hypothetical protein OXPF_07310 [Oxobacter pfennigii]
MQPTISPGSAQLTQINTQQTIIRESIYGKNLSTVPSERLIKKADIKDDSYNYTFKGIGYEFEPLIVIVSKDMKVTIDFDLTGLDTPEAIFFITSIDSGRKLTSFEGKKDVIKYENIFSESGGYTIYKGGYIIGAIEVVDDIENADIEGIKSKYLSTINLDPANCH